MACDTCARPRGIPCGILTAAEAVVSVHLKGPWEHCGFISQPQESIAVGSSSPWPLFLLEETDYLSLLLLF